MTLQQEKLAHANAQFCSKFKKEAIAVYEKQLKRDVQILRELKYKPDAEYSSFAQKLTSPLCH